MTTVSHTEVCSVAHPFDLPLTLTSDISQCIRLLIVKAGVWVAAKRCSRGFSSALRAAASAQTRLLLPMLWEAVWILAVILLDHSEFAAARSLLESILPQVSLFVRCSVFADVSRRPRAVASICWVD